MGKYMGIFSMNSYSMNSYYMGERQERVERAQSAFYVCICICMKYIMSKYIWYINMNSWGSVKKELSGHRVRFMYVYAYV